MSYSLTGKVASAHGSPAVPWCIDKAIPCGLILNELISNALKHAFPDRPGQIHLSLREDGTGAHHRWRMMGVGFPRTSTTMHRGLGLELVQMLTGST
jgi:two-component sensor histidine kinase